MSQRDTDSVDAEIAGLRVDDAVERIVERGGSHGGDEVRATLEPVAEDGVVTWDGVESAIGEVSTVVATPETRVELAETELAEAREAASHVDDLRTVSLRLDNLESRLETVAGQVDDLGSQLDSIVGRADAESDLFAVARDIRRLRSAANELQGTADELKADIEGFEEWVENVGVRYRELAADLNAVEESLDDLEQVINVLSNAVEGAGSASNALPDEIDDLGALWFNTVLEHRTYRFTVADIRGEISEFREWSDREARDDGERIDRIATRLDELAERADAIGEGLDGIASTEWVNRFAGEISAFDRELDSLDRPADWGEVERLLEDRRAAVEPTGESDI